MWLPACELVIYVTRDETSLHSHPYQPPWLARATWLMQECKRSKNGDTSDDGLLVAAAPRLEDVHPMNFFANEGEVKNDQWKGCASWRRDVRAITPSVGFPSVALATRLCAMWTCSSVGPGTGIRGLRSVTRTSCDCVLHALAAIRRARA